ncbi:pyrroline-5-carboxylate reductase family protein [Symbiobacterium terraclitae]|uniref:pyrroline-5-carboxylate reductase family protein n=1 Tax=Symbiobacterium terraclitae TaxID=557451 RepID=UPI0035B5570E
MNDKIAILGAGPLASILARRIPRSVRKVIIGRPKAAAVALADEVGGIASDQASSVRGCRVIFLTVPAGEVAQALAEIQPHLSAGALVVNMSAELTVSDLAETAGVRIVAAKVIGHTDDMEQGSPGVVVLDQVGPDEAGLLEALLERVGPVVRGDERRVQAALEAIRDVMVGARDELRRRLSATGLPPAVVPVAIAAAAPGVLRAVAAEGETAGREGWRYAGADETAASRVSQ